MNLFKLVSNDLNWYVISSFFYTHMVITRNKGIRLVAPSNAPAEETVVWGRD